MDRFVIPRAAWRVSMAAARFTLVRLLGPQADLYLVWAIAHWPVSRKNSLWRGNSW